MNANLNSRYANIHVVKDVDVLIPFKTLGNSDALAYTRSPGLLILLSPVMTFSFLLLAYFNVSNASKSLHGTTNSLIENMIIGVSEGFEKSLEINGVGYKFNVQGNKLNITAGFSHPV